MMARFDILAPAPRRQQRLVVVGVVLAVGLIVLLSIGIGSVYISPTVTLQLLLSRLPFLHFNPTWPVTVETIVFEIRLPRVALVGLTGAALACAGTAYQGVFRNPLADPYLMGVASGAGLGAISAATLSFASPISVPLGAFAGALLAVGAAYLLGRVGRHTSVTTLVLAGVAVGTLATAVTTFLLMRLNQQTVRVLAFLLGAYGQAGWGAVQAVVPFAALGFALLHMHARQLNLLLFDQEQAQQLGINVDLLVLIVIIAATLMTAAAVAFSGLIGFVGLIVPHTVRLLVGADHRRLLPLATLGGAGFLLLADLLARTMIAPQELPLGVITAMVGAPTFLLLLHRTRQSVFS